MAPALIGLSMFAFFMGVSRPNITENTSADVVGMLLAAVTLAPLCLFARRFHHPLQTFFHQMLLPLLAVMILAAFAVFEPLANCVVRALLSIGMYYFFGVAALFAVAFAIAGSSAREFSPTLVLSVVMGCFSLSSMAGIAFGGHLHLPESQVIFMPVVVVAFIAYSLLPILLWGFGAIRPPARILKKIRSIRLSRHLLLRAVKVCRKNSLSRRGRAKFSAF